MSNKESSLGQYPGFLLIPRGRYCTFRGNEKFESGYSNFRVYVYAMDIYVPGFISMQVIRDGIRQLVRTVPLRTGTAVHVFFCVLPLREAFL